MRFLGCLGIHIGVGPKLPQDWRAIFFVEDASREAHLSAVSGCWKALEVVAPSEDSELALVAVSQSAEALRFVSPRLRDDYEFMAKAVKVDGRSLHYASSRLQADRTLLLEASKLSSWAIDCAPQALREDEDFKQEELCLQRLPRPTSTISGSVPPIDGVAATRRRLEALTTEAAMEGAALEEAQVEMKELRRELQSLSQQLSSCDLHSLESERQTLMEEEAQQELVQEEFLMQSKQMLEERDRELAECSAYWEAVPFLSTETCSLEEWQEDLEVQRSELWQLQSELKPGRLKISPTLTSKKFMEHRPKSHSGLVVVVFLWSCCVGVVECEFLDWFIHDL
eukprot:s81_g14.t2